jgi:hypothetical protein
VFQPAQMATSQETAPATSAKSDANNAPITQPAQSAMTVNSSKTVSVSINAVWPIILTENNAPDVKSDAVPAPMELVALLAMMDSS